MKREPTSNLEAYDCFLRGREQWWRFTKEANAEAQVMLKRAIELDPNFATAFSWLAASHLVDHVNQWGESAEQSKRLHAELSRHAVSLDEHDSFAHVQFGMACLFAGKHDMAIAEGQKAIALDPNFAHARFDLAWFLHYAGKQEEALDMLDESMRLDPHFPDMILHLRALAYFQLGHFEEARAQWREALRISPGYSLEYRRKALPYKNPGDFERVVDGLRKASVAGVDGTP